MVKCFTVCLLFQLYTIVLHSQEVSFANAPRFDSTGMQAAISNKILFIDMYTSWCGPCKWMDKEVFTKKKVKDFFEKNFINIKYDAEKGDGLEIAEKYQVDGYPTFLFLKGGTEVLVKHVGALDSESLIELGRLALVEAQSKDPVSLWDKRYHEGERAHTFLLAYIDKRKKLSLPVDFIVEAYLKTLPQDSLKTASVRKMIGWNSIPYGGLGYSVVKKWFKEQPYNYYLTGSYYSLIRSMDNAIYESAGSKRDTFIRSLASEVYDLFDDSAQAKRFYKSNLLKYYHVSKDSVRFIATARAYMDEFVRNNDMKLLRISDSLRLRKALIQEFGHDNTSKIAGEKKYQDLKRLFRYESKEILRDMVQIGSFVCNNCRKSGDDKIIKETMEWMQLTSGFDFHGDKVLKEDIETVIKCLQN